MSHFRNVFWVHSLRKTDHWGQQVVFKKKRVTAGEVDKLGKELENCTHQWTTNDDTDTQALSTVSLLQVKEER